MLRGLLSITQKEDPEGRGRGGVIFFVPFETVWTDNIVINFFYLAFVGFKEKHKLLDKISEMIVVILIYLCCYSFLSCLHYYRNRRRRE